MLMLAIHATILRMENEAYAGRWTDVRENPIQQRRRPLSDIERMVSDMFLRLQGVDIDAAPIDLSDSPTIPLCPIHEANLREALSQ